MRPECRRHSQRAGCAVGYQHGPGLSNMHCRHRGGWRMQQRRCKPDRNSSLRRDMRGHSYAQRGLELDGKYIDGRGWLQCIPRHGVWRALHEAKFISRSPHYLYGRHGGCWPNLLLCRDGRGQHQQRECVLQRGPGRDTFAVGALPLPTKLSEWIQIRNLHEWNRHLSLTPLGQHRWSRNS